MAKSNDRLTLLSLQVDKTSTDLAKQMNGLHVMLQDYLLQPSVKWKDQHPPRIVIVGGGMIGLMVAYYSHQLGLPVTVIERKSFGAAASGRNGGGILALGRQLEEVPFVRVSMDLWEQLTQDGIETHFLRSGHAMVAMNTFEAEKLGRAQELYRLAGLDTDYLDPSQVNRLLPDLNTENKGSLYSHIDAQSYPFTSIDQIINRLKADGVKFYSHCEVTGFQQENQKIISVITDHGEIKADLFIMCTGPWTKWAQESFGLSLPITPRRSQIMVTEILTERQIPPFVSGNELYLRQTHAGNVLYGGGGSWEETGFHVNNTMQAIHLLSERLVELFPSFQSKQLIRAFAGTVEITPDHFPLFGLFPNFTNLYISAGYNGHGFGMAAVMGKLLIKLIASHHETEANPLPKVIDSAITRFRLSRFTQMLKVDKE